MRTIILFAFLIDTASFSVHGDKEVNAIANRCLCSPYTLARGTMTIMEMFGDYTASCIMQQFFYNDSSRTAIRKFTFADVLPLDQHFGAYFNNNKESLDLFQHAFEHFNTANPLHGVVFPSIVLMTKTAHIAFERHLIDNDVRIVRVDITHDKKMDTKHLQWLINNISAENIVAIVSSTPAYPYGIAEDIRVIADIAGRARVPLHVDAYLVGFMPQFAD